MNPGIMMLPVMAREEGSRRSSSRHSSAERPSFQRMAGRSGRSCASSSVAPCIWPERPTARTLARAAPGSALTARTVACHQASGDCSENPGARPADLEWGRGRGRDGACSVRSTALTLEVPMSMPRYSAALQSREWCRRDGSGIRSRVSIVLGWRRAVYGPAHPGTCRRAGWATRHRAAIWDRRVEDSSDRDPHAPAPRRRRHPAALALR